MPNYPYVSSQGALVKAFDQFRKSFPQTLDAEALKKFNIAPANESYVLNTFRFLGVIDDDGKRNESATEFFFSGDDAFEKGLNEVLLSAYEQLFSDFGAEPWNETKEALSTWFRVTDKTTELVGGRQAQTFLTLAALAGHGEVKRPTAKAGAGSGAKTTSAAKTTPAKATQGSGTAKTAQEKKQQPPPQVHTPKPPSSDLGLSVRIEVNLPATGTPETYDAIFASIRKNLIDR